MKVSKTQLRRLIAEERAKLVTEQAGSGTSTRTPCRDLPVVAPEQQAAQLCRTLPR